MKQISSPKPGLRENSDGYPVGALLSALLEDPDQYRRLVGFARLRLRAITSSRWLQQCLQSVEAEDLVQQAILKLLIGENEPRLGRHLKAQNRTSLGAFVACIRGIIASDLFNLVGEVRNRCEHRFIGDSAPASDAYEPVEPLDAFRLVSRRDLHLVLFQKLYQRIQHQPSLLPLVQDWEARFLDDYQIGDENMNRNLIFRVRALAREIIAELACEVSPTVDDGREMVL